MINKARKLITKFIIVGTMLLIMSMPVFAASSRWSMSMSSGGCQVDGSSNGVYHRLDEGQVKITGTLKTVSNKGLSGDTNKLYISLYNKTSGNYFGTASVKPSANINGTASISHTYEESVGGGTKYYLVIYRGNSDGTALSVSDGKLANK